MKKLFVTYFALILLSGFSGNASAYMYSDSFTDGSGGHFWETYGMDVNIMGNSLLFDIYTNYPGWDMDEYVADFGIDVNKDSLYEYGVTLKYRCQADNDDNYVWRGGLYHVDTSYNIDGTWANTGYGWQQVSDKPQVVNGWYIPEHYDCEDRGDNPVTVYYGDKLSSVALSWQTLAGSPDYRLSFSLERDKFLSPGDTSFNFYWGTAVCANDEFYGTVNLIPEPASIIMMIMGLFGFGFFRKRK